MTSNPVTVTVAYHVRPGREPDFHAWGWAMLGASSQQPGFLGGGVLVEQEAEWHVVYRFASEGTARAWEDSTARAQWDVRVADVARQTERRSVRGSKVWFDSRTAYSLRNGAFLPDVNSVRNAPVGCVKGSANTWP